MIRVLLAHGAHIDLNASPGDVKVESGVLVVRRDGNVIANLRRNEGWHEIPESSGK